MMSDAAVQPEELKYPAGDPRWFDGVPKQKVRLGDAFRSFKIFTQDPEETKYVFEMINALAGQRPAKLYRRFVNTDYGRKTVESNSFLLDVLIRRDWLRSLPEGTLGRTYIDFLDFEGLSPEGLMQAEVDGQVGGSERKDLIKDPGYKVFFDRLRDSHDLWHIVSGYGRDGLGELSLLAFSHAQTKDRGIAFLVFMAIVRDFVESPRAAWTVMKAVWEGYRNGKRANWLPAEDWEALMELPLADVRKQLNIKWPERYHRTLKTIIADNDTERYEAEFLEKLKSGAYMPIAPDAAFTG